MKTKGLLAWCKYFISENLEEDIKMIVKEKPILEEDIKNYEVFTLDKDLMSEYDKRETYLLGQHLMIEEERRIGRKEGIEQGKSEIVRAMIKKNYTLEQIMEISKLSEKKSIELKNILVSHLEKKINI